jgi:5-methylcytosine-specific restriction protein A
MLGRMSDRGTTARGTVNRNDQLVLGPTGQRGTDHGQSVYALRCTRCDHEYGANGSDVWLRRCPACGGGAPGFEVTAADVLPDAGASLASPRNPPWTRDELILALDLYMKDAAHPPGKGSQEIADLSATLNQLGRQLWPQQNEDFRNRNGVYMKLMNFRRFDPEFQAMGKTGLTRGNKLEREVWEAFAGETGHLHAVAEAIRRTVDSGVLSSVIATDDEAIEGIEGRLLTKLHVYRERDRDLVKRRKLRTLREIGRLVCSGCGFDFEATYGERGRGFIECHHVTPVETLAPEGQRVTEDDLALVCSNCHRMIHAGRPWLTLEQLGALLRRRPAVEPA